MFDKKDLKPMLLKRISEPFNSRDYLYELKYDGIRVIIYVSSTEFVIKSRNNHDVTHLYPELKVIQNIVGDKKAIFDGELVSFDNGVPSFQKLLHRNRLKTINLNDKLLNEIPVIFVCFDILYQDKELLDVELVNRKQILNFYSDTNFFVKAKTFENGIKLFKGAQKLHLEGIVAKRKNSLYFPNKRVDDWVKIKCLREETFFVHGYLLNKNKYTLFLGEYSNDDFIFVGRVSIMPDNLILKQILNLKKSKNLFVNFNEEINFIIPTFRVRVSYLERTKQNVLRQAVIVKEN